MFTYVKWHGNGRAYAPISANLRLCPLQAPRDELCQTVTTMVENFTHIYTKPVSHSTLYMVSRRAYHVLFTLRPNIRNVEVAEVRACVHTRLGFEILN